MDERDKKLHRGIQLDDKFAKTLGKMQKSIIDLNSLLEDFRDLGHIPVVSQVSQVNQASRDLLSIYDKIQILRDQNKL